MIATPSQTVGPFFSFGLTTNDALGCLVSADGPGERIRLHVRLLDGAGMPVPDAVIEIWQADASGTFDRSPHFRGFGRLGTDARGVCTFDTVRPGRVDDRDRGVHASHVNFCLFMRGLLRHIYTRAYFADDPLLDRDAVLSRVAEDRRPTLLAHPVHDAAGEWLFEIRLQGDGETVFFDV